MSIGLEVGKVTLSSYDNEWVKNFEEEKKIVKAIKKSHKILTLNTMNFAK